jgi:futalosine hydrolase
MNHLIVTATYIEAKSIINSLSLIKETEIIYSNKSLGTALMIAGVGVHTSIFELTKYLCTNKPDLIINAGIAGAYRGNANIGDCFIVNSDYFGDAGYYDNQGFVNIFNSSFNKKYLDKFLDGKLITDMFNIPDIFRKMPQAQSVTVNTAEKSGLKTDASLESMEGAAISFCAKMFNINCIHLRAVSNIVNETPKQNWEIIKAVEAYSKIIIEYLNSIKD